MVSWVVLNFVLVIYSNDSQLTYSLIGPLAVARRVIWIRSVRPSVSRLSWNWLFTFYLELNMIWGTHVVVCMTELDFLKKHFCHQNGENRPSLAFFKCIERFSCFFFSIWSIIKVYINCCMPEQISYLVKLWFLRYEPKCSWPIRLQDFYIKYISRTKWWQAWIFACWYKFFEIKSWMKILRVCVVINGCAHSGCRTRKLWRAESREETNGANWFLVCWYKFRKT